MLIDVKSLADLSKIENGVLDRLFSQYLAAAIDDCRERPGVDRPREIILKMKLAPVADNQGGTGQLDEIRGEFELKANVPVSRTRTISMAAKGKGLMYNDLSRDNVRQGTLAIEKAE
jgi:hypothetical protein